MNPEAGTIAYWRNYVPGHDKFIYILGTNSTGHVLSFTISSQTKYLSQQPHANEMVEIPPGTVACLNRPSYIQCFYEVRRTSLVEFRDLERRGILRYRASLPQFAREIYRRVQNSELLDGYDQDSVLEVLRPLAGLDE